MAAVGRQDSECGGSAGESAGMQGLRRARSATMVVVVYGGCGSSIVAARDASSQTVRVVPAREVALGRGSDMNRVESAAAQEWRWA